MASERHSLRIGYVSPDAFSGSGDDWLRLEQPPWPERPAGGIFAWLREQGKELTIATVLEYQEQYLSQCNADGTLEIEILLYRSRDDLEYRISASYGTLSEPTMDQAAVVDYIDIGMESGYQLDTVPEGTVAASWEGPVYAADGGQITPPPAITVSGQQLSWGVICLGQLKVQYTANRRVHILTLTPRTGADVNAEDKETLYKSTVTAFWGEGNYEQLEVDLPDLSGYCAGRGSNTNIDDDDDAGDCYDLHIKYHQCTGEEISRELVAVPCPGDDAEDA